MLVVQLSEVGGFFLIFAIMKSRYYFTLDDKIKAEFDEEILQNGGFISKTVQNLMKVYVNGSRKRRRILKETDGKKGN